MGSSKVRKEEAELRQIAKRARASRKEEKKSTTARKRREAPAKTSEEASATDAENIPSTIRLKHRRNAVVMAPKDVDELHRKLHLSLTPNDAKPKEGPNAAEAFSTRKGPKKGSCVDSRHSAPASSSPASPSPAFSEPNYHFEIHYKRKEILVDVVLHHIPHQKINLEETTPTRLVVDTTAHTKKYRLVLPMPEGLRVDSEKGSYELENGVLHCRLPILNEEIPAELRNEWDRIQERIREQRALRFRVNKEGGLTVRMRKTLLAQSPAEQARLQAARAAKRPRRGEGSGKEEASNGDRPRDGSAIAKDAALKSTSAGSAGKAKAMKTETNPTKVADKEAEAPKKPVGSNDGKAAKVLNSKDKKASSMKASNSNANNNNSNNGKKDVFAEEHSKAMSIAKSVVVGVRHSIREKVQLAKEVQKKRLERINVRSERQEQRRLREAESFQRVIEEQKRQLLAHGALKASTEEAARKKEQERKGKQGPAKSVSFKD